MKIIIDTDPGVDDALALFYTFAAPVFDLVGLTAIFGNVTVETATENAIWLCEAVGRPDIPVAMGAREPLAGHAHAPSVAVHGPHGFGNLPRRRPRGQAVAMDAADFLIARAAADPVGRARDREEAERADGTARAAARREDRQALLRPGPRQVARRAARGRTVAHELRHR